MVVLEKFCDEPSGICEQRLEGFVQDARFVEVVWVRLPWIKRELNKSDAVLIFMDCIVLLLTELDKRRTSASTL